MYSMAERIVAYSVFESFTPRAAGAPASLTEEWPPDVRRTLARPARPVVGAGADPRRPRSRGLYGLFFYVFPWVSQLVNPQEVTVE